MSETEAAGTAGPPPPTSPEALHARLDALGIAYRSVSHPPVFTVEEAKALRGELPGAHIKNLFLRNKKGQMWLVTCLEDRAVDLKSLGERLGAGRFSFGSAERLMTYLGVMPGAVTPFAVINDTGGAVTMVLDSGVMAGGVMAGGAVDGGGEGRLVNCHPLVNSMTTALAPGDLVRFLEAEGHPPQMLEF